MKTKPLGEVRGKDLWNTGQLKNILLWEELYQKHQHYPFHTLLAVLYVNPSNTVYFFPLNF